MFVVELIHEVGGQIVAAGALVAFQEHGSRPMARKRTARLREVAERGGSMRVLRIGPMAMAAARRISAIRPSSPRTRATISWLTLGRRAARGMGAFNTAPGIT